MKNVLLMQATFLFSLFGGILLVGWFSGRREFNDYQSRKWRREELEIRRLEALNKGFAGPEIDELDYRIHSLGPDGHGSILMRNFRDMGALFLACLEMELGLNLFFYSTYIFHFVGVVLVFSGGVAALWIFSWWPAAADFKPEYGLSASSYNLVEQNKKTILDENDD